MDLLDYLRSIRRWLWLLILLMLVGGGVGYVASLYETPVFQASTKLMISRAPDEVANGYYYFGDQQLIITYSQILATQPILAAVEARLGQPVASGVTTKVDPESLLLEILVTDADPQRAADVANALYAVLVEHNEQIQRNRYAESENSLQSQLRQVESQIASLQQRIEQASAASLQNQLTQVQSQISILEKDILQLQSEIADLAPTVDSSNRWFASPTLTPEQANVLREKNLRLSQLQTTLDYYQKLYLTLMASGQSGQLLENGQINQMQNALALYQQIYSDLLSNYEAVRLARLQGTVTISQIEAAVPNPLPVYPRPLNNALVGGAIGLTLALAIAFLLEYLDDTVKTPADMARLSDVPVIGFIAQMSGRRSQKERVYVADEPRSPVSEAFRSIRTNIEFAAMSQPIQTILVTSTTPGEGKTTIAVNLAMVFAQGGKKVILLDADLRRPHVHRHFKVSNRLGLSDIFLRDRPLESVAHSVKGVSLTVVTSGGLPPNPAEVLGSERMEKLLAELRQQGYIVVIDTPPSLVADASILAAKVDGVVLVVQPGNTQRSAVQVVLEQFNRAGARLIGVIFNRIPRNRAHYYGGHRYASAYYYGGHRKYAYYYAGDGFSKHRPAAKESNSRPRDRSLLNFLRKKNGNPLVLMETEMDSQEQSLN